MNTLIASIPSPTISFIDIGPVRVHFYALAILVGIAVAIWIANMRLTKRGAPSGAALDIALWTVPFGIFGGRIFHVITHPNDYFYAGADLLAILRVWEGGLAIYGALALGAVGAWFGARSSGVRFFSFLDAVAPGVLLAQGIGRLGNYMNQELFGLPTDLPWGLEIDFGNEAYPTGLPMGVLFHPTFLYEMILSIIGCFLLLALDRRFNLRWGKLFSLYLIYYSLVRIWVESIRIDPSEIFLGLRTNIWSALATIAIAAALFYLQNRRHPGIEISVMVNKDDDVEDVEIKNELESKDA
jgi:prolipoprotein diacylglyceryl transferase